MLIVGAGPVGLVLAWRLIEAGVDVKVFEAEAEVPDQLRASTFHPPTLDMFDESGIAAHLIANGRITPTWQIRMHASGERAEFDLSVLKSDTNHPYRLQCHQSVLSRALFERLPAGVVQFNRTVVAAGQDDDGVWIKTDDDTIRGQLLVGCDGSRSIVRKMIGADFTGGTYPDNTILVTTNLPFDDYLEGLSGVNYIWKDDGTYSLLRLPDVWRISLHPKPDQTPQQALTTEAITELSLIHI